MGYRHSAGLQHYVPVVAEEKSDYCKLAEACSEEQKRNIIKRRRDYSPEDERNAKQAASAEWANLEAINMRKSDPVYDRRRK